MTISHPRMFKKIPKTCCNDLLRPSLKKKKKKKKKAIKHKQKKNENK